MTPFHTQQEDEAELIVTSTKTPLQAHARISSPVILPGIPHDPVEVPRACADAVQPDNVEVTANYDKMFGLPNTSRQTQIQTNLTLSAGDDVTKGKKPFNQKKLNECYVQLFKVSYGMQIISPNPS